MDCKQTSKTIMNLDSESEDAFISVVQINLDDFCFAHVVLTVF